MFSEASPHHFALYGKALKVIFIITWTIIETWCLFDVSAFHPNSIPSVYRHREQAKNKLGRINKLPLLQWFFQPLRKWVYGTEGTVFFCQLAGLLSHKNNVTYSTTLAWIRCTPCWSQLQCASMAVASRSPIDQFVPLLRWAWLKVPETSY